MCKINAQYFKFSHVVPCLHAAFCTVPICHRHRSITGSQQKVIAVHTRNWMQYQAVTKNKVVSVRIPVQNRQGLYNYTLKRGDSNPPLTKQIADSFPTRTLERFTVTKIWSPRWRHDRPGLWHMIVVSALCLPDQTHGKQKPHQTTLYIYSVSDVIRHSRKQSGGRLVPITLIFSASHCRYVNTPNCEVSFAKTILEVRIYIVDCVWAPIDHLLP
jgi:hypothetical protein